MTKSCSHLSRSERRRPHLCSALKTKQTTHTHTHKKKKKKKKNNQPNSRILVFYPDACNWKVLYRHKPIVYGKKITGSGEHG
jgi:hypothetical protein